MSRTAAVVTVAGTCVLGSLAILAAGSQPPQASSRFRSGVDLVVLDVSVLDTDRRPVRGLTPAEFTILEDGSPQTLSAFTAIDLPDAVETQPVAPWQREVARDVQKNTDFTEADRRIVAFVLDDATPMPLVDILHARAMAREAVTALGPNDLACVVFALNKQGGQEFTLDRTRLLAAVERFNGTMDRRIGIDRNGTPREIFFDELDYGGATLYQATVRALQGVAEYLSDLPARRKAIVLVSTGIPLDFERVGPVDISTSTASGDQGGVARDVVNGLQECFRAAQRANVNIYGMDPGGLRAPNDITVKSASPSDPGGLNREFLRTVAENTGGLAVVNTNDAGPGMRQMLRETGSYYLLGYVPSSTSARGRFRKIQVRVSRPGVSVRTRTGYFEPNAANAAKARPAPAPLDAALASPLPKTDLAMSVTAAPFASRGGGDASVAIVLGIEQTAPGRATRVVLQIDLRMAAYRPDGRRQASRHQTIPVTLNRPGEAGQIEYELLSALKLEPGRYHLRLAAESTLRGVRVSRLAPEVAMIPYGQDTASRSGSVYCDLDVPDFRNAALSLSGAVLSVAPPMASGPRGALETIVPVVPTNVREFRRDDRVSAFLRVYQGGTRPPAPVVVTLRMVNGQGAVVAERSETLSGDRFAASRAADYPFDLPLEQLGSGPHLLTVQATSGKASARRDVRFTMLR